MEEENGLIRTFYPKFLYFRLHCGRLECHTKCDQGKKADKKNFTGVPLNKVSNIVEVVLESGAKPETGLVAVSFSLQTRRKS